MKPPTGEIWIPWAVRQFPKAANLRSEAIIDIQLPRCDTTGGARFYRDDLIDAGKRSDGAFDAVLGIAQLWDAAKARNGGYRIFATVPEVERNAAGYVLDGSGAVVQVKDGTGRSATMRGTEDWSAPGAHRTGREIRHPCADRVPVLDAADLRHLGYGSASDKLSKQGRSQAAKRVREPLLRMEAAGRMVIKKNAVDPETGKKGWRVLESQL